MSARFEYRLDLNEFKPVPNQIQDLALILRQPAPPDSQALAELMLDSYRGTVDYDGETLADAQQEVGSYFEGASGEPLLDYSRLCFSGGRLQSACLASYWGQEPAPLIAYVMTAAEAKNQGLASWLLAEVLTNLQNSGYAQVRAFITSGNIASEKLFLRLGFFRASGTG